MFGRMHIVSLPSVPPAWEREERPGLLPDRGSEDASFGAFQLPTDDQCGSAVRPSWAAYSVMPLLEFDGGCDYCCATSGSSSLRVCTELVLPPCSLSHR